jgi:hypothetical protein
MPPSPRLVALDSADDDTAGGNGVLLRVHTDSGGRFRFPLVPAGRYLLEVRSSIVTPGGPIASSLAEPPEHTQHVQVTAGEITVLKIPADEENGRIEGMVEEADGRPARDVLVTYDAAIAETGCPARLPGGLGLTVTGDDGRFVLSSVPLMRRHRVIAFRSTGDCATTSISAAVGQMVRLRLQPLGHLRLSISGLTGDETAEVTISDERVRLDTALVHAGRSWFLFSTLPAGRRLIVKARARSGQAETVVVLAPGRTSMVELTLS